MREIILTQGKVALVDDADYEYLNQWKWHAHKRGNTFYAVRKAPRVNGKQSAIQMHQMIIGNGIDSIDHRDGNGLNNTRANLRLATHQQNMFNKRIHKDNTSGLKGVSWHKPSDKWQAQIGVGGKQKYLGSFATPEEAGRAYDAAALEYHGEFAYLNIPTGG